MRNNSEDSRHHPADTSWNCEAGWNGRWFGIHRLSIVQADIRVVAVSTAIVAAAVIFGVVQVWSRVSTLWE